MEGGGEVGMGMGRERNWRHCQTFCYLFFGGNGQNWKKLVETFQAENGHRWTEEETCTGRRRSFSCERFTLTFFTLPEVFLSGGASRFAPPPPPPHIKTGTRRPSK